jgi:hypothetical protein
MPPSAQKIDMLRRLVARGALAGAMLVALAAPGYPQTRPDDVLIGALAGRWKLVYMDSATCSYSNITIGRAGADGRADALFDVACGGVKSVYKFAVANAGRFNFVFYGVSVSGPNGIAPNRLKYELTFDRLDCTLTGRWFIDAPIGRLTMRKEGEC